MSESVPATVWRITGTPELPNLLSIVLAVDTQAEDVIERIENALGFFDIQFHREERPAGQDWRWNVGAFLSTEDTG